MVTVPDARPVFVEKACPKLSDAQAHAYPAPPVRSRFLSEAGAAFGGGAAGSGAAAGAGPRSGVHVRTRSSRLTDNRHVIGDGLPSSSSIGDTLAEGPKGSLQEEELKDLPTLIPPSKASKRGLMPTEASDSSDAFQDEDDEADASMFMKLAVGGAYGMTTWQQRLAEMWPRTRIKATGGATKQVRSLPPVWMSLYP